MGSLLALLQHGADQVIEWGFHSLEKIPEDKKAQQKKGMIGNILRFGKGSVRFVGRMGSAYYQRYEELKKNDLSE